KKPLILFAPLTPPQFIQRNSDGGAIKPAPHFRSVRFRGSPEFAKNVDGQFFCPRGIARDPRDDLSNALVILPKRSREIEWGDVHRQAWEPFCVSVHITSTPANRKM